MLAADTDAEVRRLTNGFGDQQDMSASIGANDTSLFQRVHEAHQRIFRKLR